MRSDNIVFGFVLLLGFYIMSWQVLAGPIPEPTPDLPEGESIAYRAETKPTIDGDLSDWEKAAFHFIGDDKDIFRGNWKGPDDLSYVWSVMWDDDAFYFAAAVWDDVYQEPANANEPWTGDCLFLYIDANMDGVIDNKPCFFQLKNKPSIFPAAGGIKPESVELVIVAEPQLGKAGRIFEVAIPLKAMKDMKPSEGGEFRMMPGYEEGTQGAEAGKFIDWDGLDPDQAVNLRKVTFGGLIQNLAVAPSGKVLTTWGTLKRNTGSSIMSNSRYVMPF